MKTCHNKWQFFYLPLEKQNPKAPSLNTLGIKATVFVIVLKIIGPMLFLHAFFPPFSFLFFWRFTFCNRIKITTVTSEKTCCSNFTSYFSGSSPSLPFSGGLHRRNCFKSMMNQFRQKQDKFSYTFREMCLVFFCQMIINMY